MKRFWQNKTILLVALLFLAGIVMPSMTAHAYTSVSPKETISGMELVTKTQEASLYLDKESALLCVVDNNTGKAYETKIWNGDSGNATIKANQKSDFIISYWKDDRTAGTTTQVNYTMALEAGQVEYESVENGVRITYDLKEDKLSMEIVPKYISEDRMVELVLSHLTAKERDWLNSYYRLFNGRYTRTVDGTDALQTIIKEVQRLFYEVGEYTYEDLEADNAEWDYETDWNNLEIKVSIEYTLEGSDLLVRMPMDSLYVNSDDLIVNSITLVPYLMSATVDEKGYYIVPDGSGAVINFNNGLIFAADYSSRVYGHDVLLDINEVPDAEYYAMMPVIGAVYDDYALLGIVENGVGMTEINARVSGKLDNYNTAFFRFYIQDMENVATTQTSNVMVNKFTGDVFDEDIVIRFKMLTNPEDLNYSELAHTYQDYLVQKGVLSRKDSMDPSLYLEILGSSLESKTFLGFPYSGTKSLTTFKEAASILENLSSLGVESAKVQLNGWLDGGERHEKLTSMKIESTQGSKADFNKLLQTASSLGYEVYPDVSLQEINPSFDFMQGGSARSYAKKYGSRYLDNDYATITEQLMTGIAERQQLRWSPFLLSPSHLVSYTKQVIKGLDKMSVTGVTVNDLGKALVADYNEKAPVSRENASRIVGDALTQLAESVDVIVKNPYQYAWKNVGNMSDLPVRSNEYTVFAYDIPFLQLVLDGCASYSTEPLNYRTQENDAVLLMRCIETRSNPKYYVMKSDMSALRYMLYANYLSITYDVWGERIGSMYQEYKAFADQVADSRIVSHETLSANLKKVEYDNGVTVYLNYSDSEATVDGHKLAAQSYLVEK